ncbi:hypothetical protein FB451DRAFT_1394142 [Mycena latifolia]|nr:hypothetical protein FB451DRAFT_1394142 [Mycena latifolia]
MATIDALPNELLHLVLQEVYILEPEEFELHRCNAPRQPPYGLYNIIATRSAPLQSLAPCRRRTHARYLARTLGDQPSTSYSTADSGPARKY